MKDLNRVTALTSIRMDNALPEKSGLRSIVTHQEFIQVVAQDDPKKTSF